MESDRRQVELPHTEGSPEAKLRKQVENKAYIRSLTRMGHAPECINSIWYNQIRDAFAEEIVIAFYKGMDQRTEPALPSDTEIAAFVKPEWSLMEQAKRCIAWGFSLSIK